jgi:Uma2 family endonuclease
MQGRARSGYRNSFPQYVKNGYAEQVFLYQRMGVKEFWLVHPFDKTVKVFRRNEQGEYGRADMYASDDKVSVLLLGELIIDLNDVFLEQG